MEKALGQLRERQPNLTLAPEIAHVPQLRRIIGKNEQSAAGRAMLEKMPLIISKTMTLVQSEMGDIMPEIQRIVKEVAQN